MWLNTFLRLNAEGPKLKTHQGSTLVSFWVRGSEKKLTELLIKIRGVARHSPLMLRG